MLMVFSQVSLAGGLNKMSMKQTQSPEKCHGSSEMMSVVEQGVNTSSDTATSCCDDGCSMTNCHASTVVLGYIDMTLKAEASLVYERLLGASITSFTSSLYRPPITA